MRSRSKNTWGTSGVQALIRLISMNMCLGAGDDTKIWFSVCLRLYENHGNTLFCVTLASAAVEWSCNGLRYSWLLAKLDPKCRTMLEPDRNYQVLQLVLGYSLKHDCSSLLSIYPMDHTRSFCTPKIAVSASEEKNKTTHSSKRGEHDQKKNSCKLFIRPSDYYFPAIWYNKLQRN